MPAEAPLVDILLPVYGDATYIYEAMESLKSELNSSIQLIIIFDRPNKATENEVRKFVSETPNTSILIAEPKGLVGALNTGLFASQAKYIARMDSDDVCLSGRLAAQLEWLNLETNRILCGTQIKYIDSFGMEEKRTASRYPIESRDILREICFRNPFAHPSVIFDRMKALEVGGYRDCFVGGEDLDLWFRLAKHGKIGNLSRVYLKYRISDTQFTKEISTQYLRDEPRLYHEGILGIRTGKTTKLTLVASSQLRSIEQELNRINLMVLAKVMLRFTASFILCPSLAVYYAGYRIRLRYEKI